MENFKCCFCGEIFEPSEAGMWGHIQMSHPEEFEDLQDLSTPDMVQECYLPADAKYGRKVCLVTPAFACEMIAYLERHGKTNQNGDRMSCYFPIAMGKGKKRRERVVAALVEEANGIPKESAGYSLHVINDVDGADCQVFTTEHLDEGELALLLNEILDKLANGYL